MRRRQCAGGKGGLRTEQVGQAQHAEPGAHTVEHLAAAEGSAPNRTEISSKVVVHNWLCKSQFIVRNRKKRNGLFRRRRMVFKRSYVQRIDVLRNVICLIDDRHNVSPDR